MFGCHLCVVIFCGRQTSAQHKNENKRKEFNMGNELGEHGAHAASVSHTHTHHNFSATIAVIPHTRSHATSQITFALCLQPRAMCCLHSHMPGNLILIQQQTMHNATNSFITIFFHDADTHTHTLRSALLSSSSMAYRRLGECKNLLSSTSVAIPVSFFSSILRLRSSALLSRELLCVFGKLLYLLRGHKSFAIYQNYCFWKILFFSWPFPPLPR